MRCIAVSACLAGLLAGAGHAQGFVEWHTENVQLLRGFDYELGDRRRTIVTIEHANRWRFGDLFLFADVTWGDDGQRGVYGEVSPRFSLSRMTGRDIAFPAVRDIYIATNFELGDEGLDRRLAGLAADLDVPGFRFLRVHAYHRNDPERPGSTWQWTLVWNRSFRIGGQAFLTEGFADLAGGEGAGTAHQLVVPRLLWQVPETDGLYLGVEYQYWRNKFGVPGVDERVAQLQLKWTLG
ncbi:outer membrane protein OmpK [Maricaulis sp.]|uniref:outer membrane protein OmpK n=1 Tax=Maricaulis sp. TaxID=1486257 RepID=UPI0026297D49|nr:outer membrane protein OmpK [Maricaulis sp.]